MWVFYHDIDSQSHSNVTATALRCRVLGVTVETLISCVRPCGPHMVVRPDQVGGNEIPQLSSRTRWSFQSRRSIQRRNMSLARSWLSFRNARSGKIKEEQLPSSALRMVNESNGDDNQQARKHEKFFTIDGNGMVSDAHRRCYVHKGGHCFDQGRDESGSFQLERDL